ncbi:MAG: hypothetical protein OXE57_01300 [Alphaproteobacteria bacterium]|nr:hypothetical protein [Alphaproteobacteria bacterium]
MCISIRESRDGMLYIAVAGGPGIPRVDPVAERILFDAVDAHNESVRNGAGPIISLRPSYDESSGRYASRFAYDPVLPSTLPPVIRLPAQPRRSWRRPIAVAAFTLLVCLATFTVPAIFGSPPRDAVRPVLFDVITPPPNALTSVTGPKIK